MAKKITELLLAAIGNSPSGIATLDVLESLGLCDRNTLKTSLSRLGKAGRIIRLKRGVYSTAPLRDAFVAATAVFGGYLGFTSALYLHGLITETPFRITVVTPGISASKTFGAYEFRAVALREKAVGFERKGDYVVSTRAKTLFDCIYLPEYAVDVNKLEEAFRQAGLDDREWAEFDDYAKRFAGRKGTGRFTETKLKISGRG